MDYPVWMIVVFTLFFSVSFMIFLYIYQPFLALKSSDDTQAIQKLERELLEVKAVANQSKLNPHFIGNLLNLSQAKLYGGDAAASAEILKKVGHLSRQSFEISNYSTISLEKELDFLRAYVEVCQLIIPFKYEIHVDDNLDEDDLFTIELPVFLLQPYLENAILHSIKNRRDGEGKLEIHIKKLNDDELLVSIYDNGKPSQQVIPQTNERISSTIINSKRLEHFASEKSRNSRIIKMEIIPDKGSYIEMII